MSKKFLNSIKTGDVEFPIPTAADDGKVLEYNHAGKKYEFVSRGLDTVSFGISSSFGKNSYVQFSNGLIIQFGRVYDTQKITFPIPFPNVCRSIVITSRSSSGHTYVSNVSKTGATVKWSDNNKGGYYVALGY